ncbi:MAG TPA: class I SAM-dependent methyltransferase [Roseiflexaceae bacterium]|nr:class I SAM-dependent methyltransferase [Roseiflexaceae bacterium]
MQFDEAELYSGLAILHWANYTDPGWDHDYYQRAIERNGGVALDIGCGSGRLLRSYLRAGLNVEGADISADMLDACHSLAAEEGLTPVLHHQAMQQLDLPGRYNTIYIPCGTFVCVMDREEALEALRRFHRHLAPGGELVFNIFNPDYDYSGATRHELPQPWQPWVRYPQRDGRMLVVERRLTAIEPIEQYEAEERRFRLFNGEELVSEEIRAGQSRWYFKHEVLLMLRLAGFNDVRVTGDYTDEAFGPQHTRTMVFSARRSEHV